MIARSVSGSLVGIAAALAATHAACGVGTAQPAQGQAEQSSESASQPPATPAQERAELTFRLDEVLVSATQTRQSGFETPYSTDVVGSGRIVERLFRTTPESIQDIPGVMVQKTSHGQGSPFIRGFTGFRTLMLVDGVRLNNSVFRDGPNQYLNTVDPFSLDRIEVVKGPSSVLNGSDAIGGTISAFTKRPNSYGEGVQSSGRAFYRYSSGEDSHIARGELSVSQADAVGAIVGFSHKNFGDVEAGAPTNDQPNTGHEEFDIDAKAEVWLAETTRFVAAHQIVRQNNVPRTHRTIFAVPFKGTTVGSDLQRDLDQERELTYIQLHGEELNGPIDAMSFNISLHQQKETRDRIRGNGARDLQGFTVNTLGLWGRFTSETPIGTLSYGAEWYRDGVDSFSTNSEIQGPVADNATYDLVGVYLQNQIDLTERVGVVVGGRYTYANLDAESVQDPRSGERIAIQEDWESFVGSARATVALAPESVNLFAGVSQGFRAPNLSDLTRLDTARTNEIETPAPGLDPEEFISYEAGVKLRSERWSAQASYFYTDIEDLILRTPTGRVIDGENEVTKRNSDGGFVQGIELDATFRPRPDWSVFGSVAWLDSEVETFPTSDAFPADEPLSRQMPLNGRVGVRYDHPEGRFWIEGMAVLFDDADDLSTRDIADTSRIPPGGTPGFEVFSIRGGWRLDDQLRLTLALENITDENYRIHGSGQNEPGRSVVVGVEFTF